MSAVEITNVTKDYKGNVRALDAVNARIDEGTICVLLGPNGAGKTTLLYLVATILRPSKGSIRVFGLDSVKNSKMIRRNLGFAFAEATLFNVDIFRALWAHARISGVPKEHLREKIETSMRELQIWSKRDRRLWSLSAGERKRVEICKLMITRPRLAIFDEPTAMIDIDGKHNVWELIRQLKREGSTILIATNEIYEAEYLAEELVILNRGKVVETGSIENLRASVPGREVIEVEDDASMAISDLSQFGKTLRIGNAYRIYTNDGDNAFRSISEMTGVKSVRKLPVTLDDVFLLKTGEEIL